MAGRFTSRWIPTSRNICSFAGPADRSRSAMPAAPGRWSGLVPPATPPHLNEAADALNAPPAAWNFQAGIPVFSFDAAPGRDGSNLPAALSDAIHQLDWTLGLRYDARLVSPLCLSEPYLLFVHHVLARAEEFRVGLQRVHLKNSGRENKIRTPGRPMPNLKCMPEGARCRSGSMTCTGHAITRAAVARDAAIPVATCSRANNSGSMPSRWLGGGGRTCLLSFGADLAASPRVP